MASFEVVFKRSVSKDLRQLPKKDIQRILARIDGLANDPYPPGAEKLSGQQRFRVRQGMDRILYEVHDHELLIVVVKVGHRRDVCR